jgi:hypothetical protein
MIVIQYIEAIHSARHIHEIGRCLALFYIISIYTINRILNDDVVIDPSYIKAREEDIITLTGEIKEHIEMAHFCSDRD